MPLGPRDRETLKQAVANLANQQGQIEVDFCRYFNDDSPQFSLILDQIQDQRERIARLARSIDVFTIPDPPARQ